MTAIVEAVVVVIVKPIITTCARLDFVCGCNNNGDDLFICLGEDDERLGGNCFVGIKYTLYYLMVEM